MRESMDSNISVDTQVHANAEAPVARRSRLLIAEDEWTFRVLLLLAFEDEGYEVVTVGNGPKLLEVLATSMLPNSGIEPFDLVVSDVRMPGWSGLLALEDLCRSPLVPPVMVITAFGSDELHRRAAHAGAAAVLDKPFDLAELTALGRRLVSEHAT